MKLSGERRGILLIVATLAVVGAFWVDDHRRHVDSANGVIAVLMLAFFVSATLVLFAMLGDRDRARKSAAPIMQPMQPMRPELEGTVYGLIAGERYRVERPFADYHGNRFEAGEILRFKERHFLPYHGGHTLVFDERSMYLQEEEHASILGEFAKYVARFPAGVGAA